jgi:hypothetical protein
MPLLKIEDTVIIGAEISGEESLIAYAEKTTISNRNHQGERFY